MTATSKLTVDGIRQTSNSVITELRIRLEAGQVKEVQDLLAQFPSFAAAGRALGCSHSWLGKLCRPYGIHTSSSPPNSNQQTELGLSEGLADGLHKHLFKSKRQWTLRELSEKFDRSQNSIEAALTEIAAAGYAVQVQADPDEEITASMSQEAPPIIRDIALPNHAITTVKLGILSDTHIENLCHCADEVEQVYDIYQSEGITAVLHAGDLSDGPGERGFRGHHLEVQRECQTFDTCVRYTIDHYPKRDDITTYFIESSKSHAGWEYQRSGRSIGHAVSSGFMSNQLGPRGEQNEFVVGRQDLRYLGFDEENIWLGPEQNTKITLVHPDGGTAHAVSWMPQKWVESLAGGSKPHLAVIGHYHKSNTFRPRDVRVICPGCMCWQTPYMRRKRLAAEVAAWFIEMDLDNDGSIRRMRMEEMPFYPPEQKKRTIL